jgi:hypothetical protein
VARALDDKCFTAAQHVRVESHKWRRPTTHQAAHAYDMLLVDIGGEGDVEGYGDGDVLDGVGLPGGIGRGEDCALFADIKSTDIIL